MKLKMFVPVFLGYLLLLGYISQVQSEDQFMGLSFEETKDIIMKIMSSPGSKKVKFYSIKDRLKLFCDGYRKDKYRQNEVFEVWGEGMRKRYREIEAEARCEIYEEIMKKMELDKIGYRFKEMMGLCNWFELNDMKGVRINIIPDVFKFYLHLRDFIYTKSDKSRKKCIKYFKKIMDLADIKKLIMREHFLSILQILMKFFGKTLYSYEELNFWLDKIHNFVSTGDLNERYLYDIFISDSQKYEKIQFFQVLKTLVYIIEPLPRAFVFYGTLNGVKCLNQLTENFIIHPKMIFCITRILNNRLFQEDITYSEGQPMIFPTRKYVSHICSMLKILWVIEDLKVLCINIWSLDDIRNKYTRLDAKIDSKKIRKDIMYDEYEKNQNILRIMVLIHIGQYFESVTQNMDKFMSRDPVYIPGGELVYKIEPLIRAIERCRDYEKINPNIREGESNDEVDFEDCIKLFDFVLDSVNTYYIVEDLVEEPIADCLFQLMLTGDMVTRKTIFIRDGGSIFEVCEGKKRINPSLPQIFRSEINEMGINETNEFSDIEVSFRIKMWIALYDSKSFRRITKMSKILSVHVEEPKGSISREVHNAGIPDIIDVSEYLSEGIQGVIISKERREASYKLKDCNYKLFFIIASGTNDNKRQSICWWRKSINSKK